MRPECRVTCALTRIHPPPSAHHLELTLGMRQLRCWIDLECTCIGDVIHWDLLHANPRLKCLSFCISGAPKKACCTHLNSLGRAPQAFTAEVTSTLPGYDIPCTGWMGSDPAPGDVPGAQVARLHQRIRLLMAFNSPPVVNKPQDAVPKDCLNPISLFCSMSEILHVLLLTSTRRRIHNYDHDCFVGIPVLRLERHPSASG